jgi:hypothetical protein
VDHDEALGGELRHEVPEPGEGDGAREQPSLCPPRFVCVALDDEGERVYVVRTDAGALEVVPSVVGLYKGESVRHVPPPDLPWLLQRADAVLRHWQEARAPGWAAGLLADLEACLPRRTSTCRAAGAPCAQASAGKHAGTHACIPSAAASAARSKLSLQPCFFAS